MAEDRQKIRVRVVGVGGAGVKIAGTIAASGDIAADFAAVDTDADSLRDCPVENAACIGASITNSMGSGGDASAAKEAAIADLGVLKRIADGTDIFICIAGLGGGTGSVVAPILCKLAAESSAKLVVSFSLLPLSVEGSDKASLAHRSARYMRKVCDAAAVLPNDIILARSNLPVREAFDAANMYIISAVREICAMLSKSGIVNIDLPSFKKVFFKKGNPTFFGIGCGSGANAVADAVGELSVSPLINGGSTIVAESLMLSLVCGESFGMNQMQSLFESAAKTFGVSEKICFGAIVDKRLGDKIKVCAMGIAADAPVQRKMGEFAPVKPQPAEPPTPTQNLQTPDTVVSEQAVQVEPEKPKPARQFGAEERALHTPTPDEKPVEIVREEPKKKSRGFFGFGRSKRAEKAAQEASQTEQSEFKFVEMSEQRGFFADTPVNIRKGEDLDVPTFMRRNIKINLGS